MNWRKQIKIVTVSSDPWVFIATDRWGTRTLVDSFFERSDDRHEVFEEAKRVLMNEENEATIKAGYDAPWKIKPRKNTMKRRRNPTGPRSHYRHKKLKSARLFAKGSFRTIKIGKHGKLLHIGCPKGKWKRKRCLVGMKKQGLLTPKRNPHYGHTQDQWSRLSYLARKMERIAEQRDREYTRVDDLPKKEATEYRKLIKVGQDWEGEHRHA